MSAYLNIQTDLDHLYRINFSYNFVTFDSSVNIISYSQTGCCQHISRNLGINTVIVKVGEIFLNQKSSTCKA